jgi:hypothetical protein
MMESYAITGSMFIYDTFRLLLQGDLGSTEILPIMSYEKGETFYSTSRPILGGG